LTVDEQVVGYLNYLVKTYNGYTKLIAQTQQRLLTIPGEKRGKDFDSTLKGEDDQDGLNTIKGRLTRAIEKELPQFEVWERWLKSIPGIGPMIAAKLIISFKYRFYPICKECGGKQEKVEKSFVCLDCGKKASGEGLLEYRMEEKDFPTISKWWKYMGRHTVNGIMPKREKGVKADWSTEKRTLGFMIGDQFNRQKDDHPYKKFLLERKGKHAKNHPDWSLGHIQNAAKNEAVKLFLSHFWTVARIIDGKPISEPYAGVIMGHTDIIKPFYWKEEKRKEEKKKKRQRDSETIYEIHG